MYKNSILFIFCILAFVVLCIPTYGQDSTHLSKREIRQQKKEEKAKEGKFLITPLVGPAYTPELGFTIAGGVLTSWRTDKKDTALQRSSMPFNIGIGFKSGGLSSFFISSKPTTFWLHDKLRINADIWLKDMNDNYFGIGYDENSHIEQSDTTTKFERTWVQFYPHAYWQFRKNYFIGAGLDLNYTKGSNACDMVANDPNYAFYNERPFNMGFGPEFMIDTRDIAVNAWSGWFLQAQATFYGHYLGGDNNYQMYGVDVRHYIRVNKPGQTLALQLRGRFTDGDVPYGEMSQLGTPFDLRGYHWGQYRDNNMIFGIAEYRHTFYRSSGKRSKSGAVVWLATGSIASSWKFENWLPNGGIGYRLEVQPRMNLRLDLGFGEGTMGFYFNFNEAF